MSEKIPNPKEIEKEISEFLAKRFGNSVKIVSPIIMPESAGSEKVQIPSAGQVEINFDLKPEELVSYLDRYIVKQDSAKAVLATKICTHFNRIKFIKSCPDDIKDITGNIKNNVLVIGPTGVGKTYLIKLIAKKIGVPFVKGDATKFSETGYVGGDVEDLVRDLYREADNNIELAQYGIIYIDEIDKIASSRNHIGADISRTGVQRALLKPLEETDVDLKVMHDPISMIQEIERYRKTGKHNKKSISTKNILFVMSGAFTELAEIISKRISKQSIGFGGSITKPEKKIGIFKHVRSEDLIKFGFESEFVGRLPVRAIFESLTEDDLFDILKNPNNPIIIGKKLDFAAYGIDIKFEDNTLRIFAQQAFEENTGARGLVNAVETALLPFEKRLPSTSVKRFPVTLSVINDPEGSLEKLIKPENNKIWDKVFEKMRVEENQFIKNYVRLNKKDLSEKYSLNLTESRIDIVAAFYCKHIMDIDKVVKHIKSYYDEVKNVELYFFKKHDINIVLEDDAIDFVIEHIVNSSIKFEDFYKQLTKNFEYGLKLIQQKTGKNRFFISKKALLSPESFLNNLIKAELHLKRKDSFQK